MAGPEPSSCQGFSGSLTSYADEGLTRYIRGAFLSGAGFDPVELEKPIVGIADLTSDFNPCHRGMPALVEQVKRGVLEAGGLPFVFPTASLGELFLSPTSMLYRNLLALETEEMVRAQPMDAVVLLGGCDKTVPAHLMAAAAVEVPVLVEVTGPMRTGSWRGQRTGACTDCRKFWARYRAGEIGEKDVGEVQGELVVTLGTCAVMGTASTMACLAEALGMMLPGGATAPADSGARLRHATATGRRAVELARSPLLARDIMTGAPFENSLRVLAALGGSTNAVIHMMAVARRAGVTLTLDDVDRVAGTTPLLVDLKPSGRYYMEDFDHAGGVPVLLKSLEDRLALEHVGVTGQPLRSLLEPTAPPQNWQDGHPPVGPALRRSGCTGRPPGLSGPGRGRNQGLGGHAGAAPAYRPRPSVRIARGRRHPPGRPRSGGDPGPRPGPAQRRPRGCRDAGGWVAAHTPAPRRPGRNRHGASFRRQDERDRLRHGGPALLS